MQFFFFTAIVSFFLFAPILQQSRIKNLIENRPISQVLIGLAIVAIMLVAELTRFPEYFVGDVAIRPTEAIRILLGVYFGCICWYLIRHLLDDPRQLFPSLPRADTSLWKWLVRTGGWARIFVNWPVLVLTAVFLVALIVPHIDNWFSRLAHLKVAGIELTFTASSADSFNAVETLVREEKRLAYSDIVLPYLRLRGILSRDRRYFELTRFGVDYGSSSIPGSANPGLPQWLKNESVRSNERVRSVFSDSDKLLEQVLDPYADCLNKMVKENADRLGVRAAVRPVSVALERVLWMDQTSSEGVHTGVVISFGDVIDKVKESVSELNKLSVRDGTACSIDIERNFRKKANEADFGVRVKAAHYIYLYQGYLLIFQDNMSGAIRLLDQFEADFSDVPNYGYARGLASYFSDESVEETLGHFKKNVDASLRMMEEVERVEWAVLDDWIEVYRNQRQRLEERVLSGRNTAAYEVIRSLAADQVVDESWEHVAKGYLRGLERYLDNNDARSEREKRYRMAIADTVGFGMLVMGYHDDTLDEERAEKASEYLREARELAHEIGGANDRKLIRNHIRFGSRIAAHAGLARN